MYILHSIKRKDFENNFNKYCKDSINKYSFIHCSDLDTYYLVAPNFKYDTDERIILIIDTNKVLAEIKWEDAQGVCFPHIYGLINKDSIIAVLPHLWNAKKYGYQIMS